MQTMVPDVDLYKVNLDEPRYDQGTYLGRAKHFIIITNPLNIFASNTALENARSIIEKHKKKQNLPPDLTLDQLWRAKHLYDSAFHPDTGGKMPLFGRMSAQVPSNMFITGCMMTFYKSTPAVIFWQWFNQSFNALVNYTNRGGDAKISTTQLGVSYVCATSGALVTALGLNHAAKNAKPLVGRFVPLVAISVASCINIPCMRAQELKEGTPIYDENNQLLGKSKNAAKIGISQVILSRVCMPMPGMIIAPFVIQNLEQKGVFRKYPWMNLPLQVSILGLCLTFATPLACALFKQKALMNFQSLEDDLKINLEKQFKGNPPAVVYYNKGL